MRRIGLKLAAFALAIAFQGTAAVDAWGLHPCPHHDGLPVLPAGAPADAGGAHAGHGTPGADQPGQHEGDHENACTCVGACQLEGASPFALFRPPQRIAATAPLMVVAVATIGDERLPSPPAFLRPYAHGPPPAA